jgi:hypothetical protein
MKSRRLRPIFAFEGFLLGVEPLNLRLSETGKGSRLKAATWDRD